MELVRDYFTVERNVVGLTLQEMEGKLGFPPGRLLHGARVLLLQRQHSVGEFVSAGSTWYPNAEGLLGVEQRRVTELAEMGVADHVLESISGHLSRRMLEHYSHNQDRADGFVEWAVAEPLSATPKKQLQPTSRVREVHAGL